MKNAPRSLNRRDFLALGLGAAFCVPTLAQGSVKKLKKPLKAGLITDLHYDLIHDGKNRLDAFLAHSRRVRTDVNIQLGDFVFPDKKNKEILTAFNRANRHSLHVIGNHDTDKGYTRQQCLEHWGMSARYYTRQVKGLTFVVLDGNDAGSPVPRGSYSYPAYIDPTQVAWLTDQLKVIKTPIVVVSHQPLLGPLAVDNAAEIRALLAGAADRVVVALNGHTHVDSLQYADEIPYMTINSASYFWIGDKFRHESYSKEIHAAYESMTSMCSYEQPLYTILTIDPATLTVQLSGTESSWVGPSPAELGFTNEYKPLATGQEIVPYIRRRTIAFRESTKKP